GRPTSRSRSVGRACHPRRRAAQRARRSSPQRGRRQGRRNEPRGGNVIRALPVGVASLGGIVLFAWPFLGSGLPASTPAWTLTLACVVGLFLIEAGMRQLDSRAVALLAAIAAIDTALRLAVIEGIGGFSPIYFLVLCAGYVFGASFGFLAGALSILVSAIAG